MGSRLHKSGLGVVRIEARIGLRFGSHFKVIVTVTVTVTVIVTVTVTVIVTVTVTVIVTVTVWQGHRFKAIDS